MPEQQTALRVAVHGHPNSDTLLLWHPGATSDTTNDSTSDIEAVAALASRIATRSGLRVVVPVWSDGRDLLRSVRFARETSVHPPDKLSVVGYAVAGIAALSLALNQRRLGIGLARVTCVDGADGIDDPISGHPLSSPTPGRSETAVDIVASADPGWAQAMARDWKAAGWAASLVPSDQFTWRIS